MIFQWRGHSGSDVLPDKYLAQMAKVCSQEETDAEYFIVDPDIFDLGLSMLCKFNKQRNSFANATLENLFGGTNL